MKQKRFGRTQSRLARYCTARFLSAFVGKNRIHIEDLDPYVYFFYVNSLNWIKNKTLLQVHQ